METDLNGLIERIKKDGVEEADKQALIILKKAQAESVVILSEARAQAKAIETAALEQAKKVKANSDATLRQAGRDLVLSLKEQLEELFKKALKEQTSEALSPEFLRDIILKLIESYGLSGKASLELSLDPQNKDAVEKLLVTSLEKSLKEKVEIKVAPHITKGFLLGVKGEDIYYDFSEGSIAESLAVFLSPSLAALLK